jgi:hypothetical protein
MRIRLVLASALLFAASFLALPAHAKPPKKSSCTRHSDCRGQGEYCQAQVCAKLGPNQSYLVVVLDVQATGPAYLYIDGMVMGTLPWEGVVVSGVHTIRAECAGLQPVEFQGTSLPGAVDTVPIRMEPMPVAPPPSQPYFGGPRAGSEAQQTAPAGERGVPGTLHLALFGGGAYGTASWGSDGWRRPIGTLLGGGAFGLRVATDPVWLDLAFAVTSETSLLVDYTTNHGDTADWGDFLKLHFGIQARLLFPIKKNVFYMGAELEPGYAMGNRRYAFVNLQFAMSIFVHEMVEIRINPLGGEYLQELRMKGWIAGFHATVGIAIRFPKTPLF